MPSLVRAEHFHVPCDKPPACQAMAWPIPTPESSFAGAPPGSSALCLHTFALHCIVSELPASHILHSAYSAYSAYLFTICSLEHARLYLVKVVAPNPRLCFPRLLVFISFSQPFVSLAFIGPNFVLFLSVFWFCCEYALELSQPQTLGRGHFGHSMQDLARRFLSDCSSNPWHWPKPFHQQQTEHTSFSPRGESEPVRGGGRSATPPSPCRWTKAMLRGRGGCYKHTFYGINSSQCMEMTPSLAHRLSPGPGDSPHTPPTIMTCL